MKQRIIFCFCLLLAGQFTFAQKAPAIRMHVLGNYVFDDAIDSYFDVGNYYRGKIMGNFQWGLGLEVMPRSNFGVSINYYRQDTDVPLTYVSNNGGVKRKDFNTGINYILIGGNRYQPIGKKAEAFGGAQAGLAIISIKNPDPGGNGSLTRFAWGLHGGAIVWAAKSIGLRFQLQLQSAVQSIGGGAYFGTSGSGVGLSTNSSVLQFGMGSGLVFKLGGK